MSGPALDGARCANHPDAQATWTCKRCGAFVCSVCERRVRPDALPLCARCWDLREQTVTALRGPVRLESAGLWLGGLSLTCLPPVILASLVINLIALSRAEPGTRRNPVIGLALTALGIGVAATAFTLLVLNAP